MRHRNRLPLIPATFLTALAVCLTVGCIHAQDEPSEPQEPKAESSKRPEGQANRLADETSPYLLMHANNPVDWRPWGPEAFEAAKEQDKPVFLSIGYSSCYWCHVMERESFEDEEIAEFLNEHFICIKVDREERPDVDQIYMTALQAFTGRGGWPLSMFLTPEGKPFFGGTYFPPRARDGIAGFNELIDAVLRAWEEQRPAIEQDANQLTEVVRRISSGAIALKKVPLTRELAAEGRAQLLERFDPEFGGFNFDPRSPDRPKFPEPANLDFLLDQHRRGVERRDPLPNVLKTLDHMARGGIRDHLGGAYHRYSTDREWAVPHFEKMLYDNAQLASTHLLAFEITGDERWKHEAEETLAFVLRRMTGPEGGFYSALDAETDEEEGKYYVWERDEIKELIGDNADDFELFALIYGLNLQPKFEGDRYVLLRPEPIDKLAERIGQDPEAIEARLAPMRAKLLEARQQRESPFLDDKVLTSWNGLMISAFADAYRLLEDETYREAAEKAADFLLETLRDDDGRLLRTYREGTSKLPAYLEDYAFLAFGLLRLHQATEDPKRLEQARSLVDRMIADFSDDEAGGFFFTANDHESLIARPKDPFDGALPGANSIAVLSLIALAEAAEEPSYLDHARKALEAFSPALEENPGNAPLLLVGLEAYLDAQGPGFAPGQFDPEKAEAAIAKAQAGVVQAEATLDEGQKVAPGQELQIQLRLSIAAPWHIYANSAGSNVIPTVVRLDDDAPAELLEVEYPEGESKALGGLAEPVPVYEGEVTLKVRLRVDGDVENAPESLVLRVRYQACDDRACMAPASLRVPVKLKTLAHLPEESK